MRMVSQAKLKSKGGGPNGQQKFITYKMEVPISYSVHSEIPEENTLWKGTSGCEGNNQCTMQI